MEKHCDVTTDKRKISVESIEFQDEIDEKLIQDDHLKCHFTLSCSKRYVYEGKNGKQVCKIKNEKEKFYET